MKNVYVAALTAACAVAATGAFAGGELAYGAGYPAPQAHYYNTYPSAAYQQVNYARPASYYYGQAAQCNPCGGGYAYGGGGGLFGMNNDILTAGLLGVGLGYLIFH